MAESHVRFPKDAARESFRELGQFFATDGRVVLSTKGVIKGVSAEGFRLIGEHADERWSGGYDCAYAGNAESVFYASSLLYPPKKLASKAPGRVSHLGKHYATDGSIVFYAGTKIERADPASFEILSLDYSRDAKSCFFRNKRIDGAERASFRLVCPSPHDVIAHYSADGTSAFFRENVIPGALGASFEAVRDGKGQVVGVRDAARKWNSREIDELMPKEKKRALVFSSETSGVLLHDGVFQGLEERLAAFLLLCSEGSVEAFEKFTSGRVGENSIVRTIGMLNERTPSPVAEVTRDTITITPLGMALYRQFAEPMKALQATFKDLA